MYADVRYWDQRFLSEHTNEWLQTYSTLQPALSQLQAKTKRVLILGCGNSLLAEHMVADGYEHIVCVDFSRVAVERMSQRAVRNPALSYLVMDVRRLAFPSCSFHLILDKGTMDALYCNRDPKPAVSAMLNEVHRVLHPDGHYVIVSYGEPQRRLALITAHQWAAEYHTLEDVEGPHECHYCYVCTKFGA